MFKHRISRHSAVCALLLLTASAAYADHAEDYLKASGPQAVLFSGNGHARYPYHFEESPYLSGDDYSKGEVICNSIRYTGVLLNYDVRQDLLYVRADSLSLPVRLEPESATSFVLNGMHFIQTSTLPGIDNKILTGYAQVLFEKDDCLLLKKIVLKPYETPEGKYMAHHLDRETSWFLFLGNKLYRIKGKGLFFKLFPQQKKELRAASRHISVQKEPDRYYMQLLQSVLTP